MKWADLLPTELADKAYRAKSELAWRRADAIRVVELLRSKGCVILGVDIWLPTQPGPTIPAPFVYDWALQEHPPSEGYAKSAEAFIRDFEWDAADKSHRGLEPYFNLTVKEL